MIVTSYWMCRSYEWDFRPKLSTNGSNFDLDSGILPVDPLFKRRKGLRNNEQKLAKMSSKFLELNLCSLCSDASHIIVE